MYTPSIEKIIRDEKLIAFDFMVEVDAKVTTKNIPRDVVKMITENRIMTVKYSCFHAF